MTLSKFGSVAVADAEYAYDWYLDPHPNKDTIPPFSEKSELVETCTLRPHIKELLGFPQADWPIIYWIKTQELAVIQNFVNAAGNKNFVDGIIVDSLSVLWDLASDTVQDAAAKSGGLAWTEAKKLMRRFQYCLLRTQKNYICTSHLRLSYNAQMIITGQGPWTEKKVPHWLDFIGRMSFEDNAPAPVLTVTGERSGGLLKRGTEIKDPSFSKLVVAFGGSLPERTELVLKADEVEYRNANAVRSLGPQQQ